MELELDFFGIWDGAAVETCEVAFSKIISGGMYTLAGLPRKFIRLSHAPSNDLADTPLPSHIYGEVLPTTAILTCTQRQNTLSCETPTGAHALPIFERPVPKLLSSEEKETFETMAKKFFEAYGASFAPEHLKEVQEALRMRQKHGLAISDKHWDEDDFVFAYKIFIDVCEGWDLATLPLPDTFADALLEAFISIFNHGASLELVFPVFLLGTRFYRRFGDSSNGTVQLQHSTLVQRRDEAVLCI